MKKKIQAIRSALAKSKADAVILMADQSRLWVTGFASSYGFLIVKKTGTPDFLLDGRYIEKARKTIKSGVNILPLKLKEYFEQAKIKSALVEREYTTLQTVEMLKGLGVKATGFDSVALRAIKEDDEIKKLQKAADISKRAFEDLQKVIKPGMTEIQVASLLSGLQIKHGAQKDSFDAIVASGVNGAYPHHQTSTKKIQDGEFVTIDFGCVYQGYCSDITRTILIGKKPIGKAAKVQEYYDIVKEAQRLGVEAVKAGVTGKAVDAVCREYIKAKGYEFGHGTGHGLGIDVHEQPYVNTGNDKPLVAGNVVTVEPGIYVPGYGGVRIEDDILVLANGRTNLSGRLAKR